MKTTFLNKLNEVFIASLKKKNKIQHIKGNIIKIFELYAIQIKH